MTFADIQAMKALKLAKQNAKKLTNYYGYNTQEGLRNFNFALADIDNNPVKIACIGDSVTFGNYTSDIFNKNWVSRLRTILQNKYGNVGLGLLVVPNQSDTASLTKWTLSGTWTYNVGNGMFGRWINASGTGSSASVTFTGTSCDLILTKTSTGASTGVAVTIDGVTQTPPNFNNSSTFWGQKQTYTGLSAGNHTLVITGSASGAITLEGLIAYNPTASGSQGVYLHNMGTPSMTAPTYATQATQRANLFTPHLSIIAFGINDARANSTTFVQDITNILTPLQNVGSSILLLPYYAINDTTTINTAYNQTMRNQMYQLADQYNCSLVDIFLKWGQSWTSSQTAGLMGKDWTGAGGFDQWHPSDKGHRDIAHAIAMNLIGQI